MTRGRGRRGQGGAQKRQGWKQERRKGREAEGGSTMYVRRTARGGRMQGGNTGGLHVH